MELETLKKKISTYRTESGKITRISDELAMELLVAWEQWTGPARSFYTAIGADHRKMAKILGKAKKMKREGQFPAEEFKEIKLSNIEASQYSTAPCSGIELSLDQGKIIRFPQVDQLIEFLKKSA